MEQPQQTPRYLGFSKPNSLSLTNFGKLNVVACSKHFRYLWLLVNKVDQILHIVEKKYA